MLAGMRSMTGFGAAEAHDETLQCRIELSSVNRKQSEVLVQLPKALAGKLEPLIRSATLTQINRGRVQVTVSFNYLDQESLPAAFDQQRINNYFRSLAHLEKLAARPLTPPPAHLEALFSPELPPPDPDHAWSLCQTALTNALDQLNRLRQAEGQHLQAEIELQLEQLSAIRENCLTLAPKVKDNYHRALINRLAQAELDLPLDDEKILREVAIFAERCDVSEELTRLQSHLIKFRSLLASDEPVGRTLDFLCQEIHRELNTLGSKANDADLAQWVVAGKTELEKIREQIQNIE